MLDKANSSTAINHHHITNFLVSRNLTEFNYNESHILSSVNHIKRRILQVRRERDSNDTLAPTGSGSGDAVNTIRIPTLI